jgi:hypothetical protein
MGKGDPNRDAAASRPQSDPNGGPLAVTPGYNFLGSTAPRPMNKGGASIGGHPDNNSSPAGHTESPSPNTAGPRGPKGNKGGTRRA